MAKLKISMDNDNHFIVLHAEAEALGYQAAFNFRVKKMVQSGGRPELPASDVIDLPPDQFEYVDTEMEQGQSSN